VVERGKANTIEEANARIEMTLRNLPPPPGLLGIVLWSLAVILIVMGIFSFIVVPFTSKTFIIRVPMSFPEEFVVSRDGKLCCASRTMGSVQLCAYDGTYLRRLYAGFCRGARLGIDERDRIHVLESYGASPGHWRVFDWDGNLIEELEFTEEAWNTALTRTGGKPQRRDDLGNVYEKRWGGVIRITPAGKEESVVPIPVLLWLLAPYWCPSPMLLPVIMLIIVIGNRRHRRSIPVRQVAPAGPPQGGPSAGQQRGHMRAE
jgi:hypothetical protein